MARKERRNGEKTYEGKAYTGKTTYYIKWVKWLEEKGNGIFWRKMVQGKVKKKEKNCRLKKKLKM
jgi:hypothetical protein